MRASSSPPGWDRKKRASQCEPETHSGPRERRGGHLSKSYLGSCMPGNKGHPHIVQVRFGIMAALPVIIFSRVNLIGKIINTGHRKAQTRHATFQLTLYVPAIPHSEGTLGLPTPNPHRQS